MTDIDLDDLGLTVHGGLIIRDEEINKYMAALGTPRLNTDDPSLNLYRWLRDEKAGWIKMVFTRLKMPGQSDNPPIILLQFSQTRVTFGDVEFTDAGLVPKRVCRASDEIKERAKRWLDLDPASDNDVSEFADRFAFIECEKTDDLIQKIFAVAAKLTGKAPKDVQFALTYSEDSMAVHRSWETWQDPGPEEGALEEEESEQEQD